MKYGILGGTFDPPHIGHMLIAQEARRQLGLDEVLWVPANKNPIKRGRQSSPRARLEMCRLATQGVEGMAVSDVETSRGGESYAVDTLEELKMVMPGDYWFIAGMDAVAQLPTWKDPERLLQLCRLAVVTRPGTDAQTTLSRLGAEVQRHIDLLETVPKSVSSSNIRDMATRGDDFSHLVAPTVYGYIKENELYED